jgi:hypothetical protein
MSTTNINKNSKLYGFFIITVDSLLWIAIMNFFFYPWVEKKCKGIEGVLVFTIGSLVIKRLFRGMLVFFIFHSKITVLSLDLTISWVVAQGFFSLLKNIGIVKILICPWKKKGVD